MIQFNCPSCKYQFKVDNSLAGKTANCAWCGKPFTIPEAHAEGTVTDDVRDPKVVQQEAARDYGDIDISLQGSQNPYASTPLQDPSGSGSYWLIIIVVIVLANLIIIPLTGYAIVPR